MINVSHVYSCTSVKGAKQQKAGENAMFHVELQVYTIIKVGCLWAFNFGSHMCLWNLCIEFQSIISWWVAVLCVVQQCFVWLVMILIRENMEKVHIFWSVLSVNVQCIKINVPLTSLSPSVTHTNTHTHTHMHTVPLTSLFLSHTLRINVKLLQYSL